MMAIRGRDTCALIAGRCTSVQTWMPRLLFWTQAAIVVFVLAGIVIALTRLV